MAIVRIAIPIHVGLNDGIWRLHMGLTAAKLRYLMTVSELQETLPHKVRCIDVAVQLGVARPSACRMISTFCQEGLLFRNHETGICLTEKGEQMLAPHRTDYHLLAGYFAQTLSLSPYDAGEAAMCFLVSAPDSVRAALCNAISHTT